MTILYHRTGGTGTLDGFRPGVSQLTDAEWTLRYAYGDLTTRQRERLEAWLAGDRQPGDHWHGSDAHEVGSAEGLPRVDVRAIRYVDLRGAFALPDPEEPHTAFGAARQLEREHPWHRLDVGPFVEASQLPEWEATASSEQLEWRGRVHARAAALVAAADPVQS